MKYCVCIVLFFVLYRARDVGIQKIGIEIVVLVLLLSTVYAVSFICCVRDHSIVKCEMRERSYGICRKRWSMKVMCSRDTH